MIKFTKGWDAATRWVFWLACLLRFDLAWVNSYANDDHMTVMRILKNDGRIPLVGDCSECFQPKLYHGLAALLFRIFSIDGTHAQIVTAQFLSVLAGCVTIFFVLKYLKEIDLSPKVRFFCFSLTVLNPGLVGINVQVTNDSFVILFATLAIYFLYRFHFRGGFGPLVAVTAFSILAALSKGNGLVMFPAVLLVLSLLAVFKAARWSGPADAAGGTCSEEKATREASASSGSLFAIFFFAVFFMATVPFLGQYYFNHQRSGTPFSINTPPSPPPDFFRKTYVERPGVTSVLDSYFTFRFFNLLQHPVVAPRPFLGTDSYELHRTSVWTQVYGRLYSFFFVLPQWQSSHWFFAFLGRASFVLALAPTLVLLWGILLALGVWFRVVFRKQTAPSLAEEVRKDDWISIIFFTAYLLFVIIYTFRFRDFSAMKDIFAMPALLPAVLLFSLGLRQAYGKKRLETVLNAFFMALLVLYCVSDVCLSLFLRGVLFV